MGIFDLDKYLTEETNEEPVDDGNKDVAGSSEGEESESANVKEDTRMGLYGNELFGYIKESYEGEKEVDLIDETFYDEDSYMGTVYEVATILEATEKINVSDFKSAAEFKRKYNINLKEAKEKYKDKPKKMSKFAISWYFAILGNTFMSDFNGPYVSLLPIVLPDIKKYCDDKQKARIMKDIENTIKKLEGIKDSGKQLNRKQKGWLKDIKAVKL